MSRHQYFNHAFQRCFLRTDVDIESSVPDKITPLDCTNENRVGCELYFPKNFLGMIQILSVEFLKDTMRRD